MKKMLFSAIAMIAFAGSAFASNEVVKEEALENEALVKEAVVEDDAACTNWVTVSKSCGGEFYLCADRYGSVQELIDRARYYDAVQCGTLTPTDPGTSIGK